MKPGGQCTVCKRADVADVDAALLGGRATRAVAEAFGASKSAIDRHARHAKAARVPKKRASRGLPPPQTAASVPRVESVDDMLRQLTASARMQVLELATNTDLTLFERAKLQGAAIQTLSLVAKLEGGIGITEERVMRHPAYRRVRDAMLRTLTPWPEALKAVVAALEQLVADRGEDAR